MFRYFAALSERTGSEYLKRIMIHAMRRLMFFIVAAGIPLVQAQAQIPADTLVTGQSQPARAQATPGGPWCFVGRGLSTFQGNASGTEAVVSLPEVTYFDGTTYYLLDGQARLDFSTASTGNIKFKLTPEYPLSVKNPPFSEYTETVENPANQIMVSFSVNFPSCTLLVSILYEME
jgi:hypothetical protein